MNVLSGKHKTSNYINLSNFMSLTVGLELKALTSKVIELIKEIVRVRHNMDNSLAAMMI